MLFINRKDTLLEGESRVEYFEIKRGREEKSVLEFTISKDRIINFLANEYPCVWLHILDK